MTISQLIFNNSPWWILVAFLVGLVYAAILYSKAGPWGQSVEKILFGLRTIAVTIVILLIINPLIKQIQNQTVPPKALIVVDNSLSLKESIPGDQLNSLIDELKLTADQLRNKGFEVIVRDLEKETTFDSIRFDNQSTNLAGVLKKIGSTYDEGDLSLCILASDGIYNLGSSPDYSNYSYPIYTVGIGDTIPKKDIIIKNVRYNKVVTKGNKFPIEVDVLHNGFEGVPIGINLALNGKKIDSKTIRFDKKLNLQTINFLVDTDAAGLNRFEISSPVLPNEQNARNNQKDIYIDIIDNKDKILLIASAPHPDIKSLRQAIDQNKNFEFINYIPGVTKLEEQDFGVVIAHQPYTNNRQADQFLNQIQEDKTPIWYILGDRTNLSLFNKSNNIIEIEQIRGQTDLVFPVVNTGFTKFKLDHAETDDLSEFPPIRVPYGNYGFKGPFELLLTQRIGNIESQKPLLVVGEHADRKEAVLLGTGIWQWRMQEFAKSDDTESFDTWVSKLIQYLNTKEDKKKFRLTTSADEYTDSESVIFEAEAYNNIYENIYDIPVNITITNELGESLNYTFTTSEVNSSYKVSKLPAGAYTYVGTANINGKTEKAVGGFSVIELQIESVNLTADFNLLRRISEKTGASFSMAGSLNGQFNNLQAQGIIYSEESLLPLVQIKWILFVIMFLVSVEWFTRKYTGGY